MPTHTSTVAFRRSSKLAGLPMLAALSLVLSCTRSDVSEELAVDAVQQALVTTTALTASADTTLVDFSPTTNFGSDDELEVNGIGFDLSKVALVRFDGAAMASAVGSASLQAATLEITVDFIGAWGNNDLSVHRMLMPWTEGGATWLCANDTAHGFLSKYVNNCASSDRWGIDAWSFDPQPYQSTPTATAPLQFGAFGTVTLDVTADVQAALDGDAHHGWLLAAEPGISSLAADFHSRQSNQPPRLLLQIDSGEPDAGPVCTPTGTDTTCDGIDDDCDGATDEAYVSNDSQCGVGACAAAGTTSCVSGQVVDSCAPGAAAAADATCDGIDDDCDGSTDEAFVTAPTACVVGGCSAAGLLSCVSGGAVDSCLTTPTCQAEVACSDGLDNDGDGSADCADSDCAAEPVCLLGSACSVDADCVDMAGTPSCADEATTGVPGGYCSRLCGAADPGGPSCPAGSQCINDQYCAATCDAQSNCGGSAFCSGHDICGRCQDYDLSCDGIDQNCSGTPDDGYVVTNTTCGNGACGSTGQLTCQAGAEVDTCSAGAGTGSDDDCDGIDNDCDQSVDESFAGATTSCGAGVCASAGSETCQGGSIVDSCTAGGATGSDNDCDGTDNDCDGSTDEAFVASSTSCGVGACAASGQLSCQSGAPTDSCNAGVPVGTDATCDGMDDDCDGTVDEGYISQSSQCGTGACASTGLRTCVAGAEQDSCMAAAPSVSDATCDGVDDDCDGLADESFVSTATQCGQDPCIASGLLICSSGTPVDTCAVDPLCEGVDSDGDGLVDAWETTHFGDLSRDGTGDFDADGIIDLHELTFGFNPTYDDSYEDLDGDRYPNIFEYVRGSDPTDPSSIPAPDQLLDLTEAGTSNTDNIHDDLTDAIAAARAGGVSHAIIGLRAGVYSGSRNLSPVTYAADPETLIIGLEGADSTILDGHGANNTTGIFLQQRTALASLTIQNAASANGVSFVGTGASGSRMTDVVLRNLSRVGATFNAIYASGSVDIELVGCTIMENGAGASQSNGIYAQSSQVVLRNTILWNPGATNEANVVSGATVEAHGSLIRGDAISGVGNVIGVTAPGLRADGRLLPGSPAIGGGLAIVRSSLLDIDLETRPLTAPDIGADQWLDVDADGLPDSWELFQLGDLISLSDAGDFDGDGVSDGTEYSSMSDPQSADTDGDAATDLEELNAGSDPLVADTDGDGLLDGEELSIGFDPLRDDTYEDLDGDRYPNVFELIKGTDPLDAGSTPTHDQLLDLASADASASDNIHNDLASALTAARASGMSHVIIGLNAGVYSGSNNLGILTYSNDPELLIIGLAGAAQTVLDGQRVWTAGLRFHQRTAVTSLTLRDAHAPGAIGFYNASGSRVSDILITGTTNPSDYNWELRASALYVSNSDGVVVENSTLAWNGQGAVNAHGIHIELGAVTLRNTILWNPGAATEFYSNNGWIEAHGSLIRGDVISGEGNVLGVTDPSLRADGRLLLGAPAIGAGLNIAGGSRLDMDLEARPASAPDVGADQWLDNDGDGVPDGLETAVFGGLNVLTSGGDFDGDGLKDPDEYQLGTNQNEPDTDQDGLPDGMEVSFGLDPLTADIEALDTDINQDGLDDSVGWQLGFSPVNLDLDGDGIQNAAEVAMGLDPMKPDTDGDSIPDGFDAFPLDPTLSGLSIDGGDTAPPVITLRLPITAQAQ